MKSRPTTSKVEEKARSSKKNIDALEFNTLQKIGLEFGSPQDEFSYQPDSGSSMDGQLGKQEYGVDTDLDADSRQATNSPQFVREDPENPILGESEWSQSHRSSKDGTLRRVGKVSDKNLLETLEHSFAHHPKLSPVGISIQVDHGEVILRGDVPTDSIKLLAAEMVESFPGVTNLVDKLNIKPANR